MSAIHRYICLAIISAAIPCLGQPEPPLSVDCAYMVPDIVEAEVSRSGEREMLSGGTVHVFVRNASAGPVEISRISIGDDDVEALHAKHTVSWWRVRPNPVAARGVSEVRVRLQRVPSGDFEVRLGTEGEPGAIRATIASAEPDLQIVNVSFEADRTRVFLLVRAAGDDGAGTAIKRVYLDGTDVTADCQRPGFFAGLGPVVLDLDQPLAHGSFHVLKVVDDRGRETACGVRAWDSTFEIGTFGNLYLKAYGQAALNTYQSFRGLSPEEVGAASEQGLRVTAPYFRARKAYFYDDLDVGPVREAVEKVKAHPGVLAYYLEDEPDVFDWQYCGEFDHWFELTFDGPREITRVAFQEFGGYSRECAVQYWVDDDWREVAAKTTAELAEAPTSALGRQIEFRFDAITLQKLRISIPRSDHMPGIREIQVFDGDDRDIAPEGKARGSSRFGAFYGRTGDEADKAVDGDMETYWRAMHSRPAWVGATGMEMARRAAFYEATDPRTLTMCLIDNTYIPQAWFTYGRVADLFDTDPYVSPSLGRVADYRSVYRKSVTACTASAPDPCFITIWMGWGGGHCRCLTEAEERIMAFYALGAGARGINYYIHSSGAGDSAVMTGVLAFPAGPERDRAQEQADALWEGVGRINRQLRMAGHWLSRGRPVEAIKSASEGLWARAVLCANGAMAIVVVNEQYEATGEDFTLDPVEAASVELAVPEWLEFEDVLEVTSTGLSPIPCQRTDAGVVVSLGTVHDGKLIILR